MLEMKKGDKFEMLGEQGGWMKARNAEGKEGFVPPAYLKADPEE